MPNYYLKNADATKIYRVMYEPADGGSYAVTDVHVTASGSQKTPSGAAILFPDQGCNVGEVVVELVLGAVTPATVAEYRTLVKTVIDGLWG